MVNRWFAAVQLVLYCRRDLASEKKCPTNKDNFRRMWEQFNILNLNLCLALAGGHVCMLLGQLEVIQADRHACTAIGRNKRHP